MVIRSLSVWLTILWYIAALVSTSVSVPLKIIRGVTDKFTNLSCTRRSCNATSSNCVGFVQASCVPPGCVECQCNFNYPTFYQKGNSHGKCVKSELLSESIGCYKYSDGSTIFTVETEELLEKFEHFSETCEKEKDISAPIEVTNKHCSIEWKRTEFLNYTRWDYVPESVLEGKPLSLVKRSANTITLKVNLKKSRQLIGQIIRLYIRCENKSIDQLKHQKSFKKQDEIETHCVLIKFTGAFLSMFSAKMSTTPETHDTDESESVSLTNVIIIVVCVVVILLIAAVILFVFFKRKRCLGKKENETSDHMYENTAQHLRAKSAESLNPIYSSGNNIAAAFQEETSDARYGYEVPVHAVSSECQLYEPSAGENVYHEPETVLNRSQPVLEHAYDYAKPDGINRTVTNLYESERRV